MRHRHHITPFSIAAQSRLTYLQAEDMFNAGLQQVFDSKTGKWLQTIRAGQQWKPNEEPEALLTTPTQDERQLNFNF